jgi:hypothetical protein
MAPARPLAVPPNSRECCDFKPPDPSSAQFLSGHTETGLDGVTRPPWALSELISVDEGYMIVSCRADSFNAYQDTDSAHKVAGVMTSTNPLGISIRTSGIVYAFNYDGSGSVTTVGGHPDTAGNPVPVPVGSGNPYVIEWWHTAGNVHQRVNGANETSFPSGSSMMLGGAVGLTAPVSFGYQGTTFTEFNGKIFEAMIYTTVPTSAQRDAIAANLMAWVGA